MARKLVTLGLVLAVISLWGHFNARAQSGQVIFLGATSGTTLAANCPAAPATPSVCVVGDGVWNWQSAATGWFKAAPPAAAGVASISVNGGTAQTGAVALTIPTTATTTGTFTTTIK